VLRLYATAEHIANFIVAFLEIEKRKLESFKQTNVSHARIVGKYLMNEMPSDEITLAVNDLVAGKNWAKAMCYRNIWVHEQPPLIESVAIVYERKGRWVRYGHRWRRQTAIHR